MNFRESLTLAEGPRRERGTYILTQEFFNVQAQFSRIRGYAEVAPEAVSAAAEAIYRKQLQITNWLLDMPGSDRYFGDTSEFRAAGKDVFISKAVANNKVTDASTYSTSSAFVFSHSVLDGSITILCEAAALLNPSEWVGYIEKQQVTIGEIRSRTPQELTFDRLSTFIHQLSRDSIVKRMKRLLSMLKPGRDYPGLTDYELNLPTIETYDRTRQNIIHKRLFDLRVDRLDEAITYMEKSFLYFAFLLLWHHGETFNKRAWDEAMQTPSA
jgi:hypothetical protein